MTSKEALLITLLQIKNEGPRNPEYGICSNARETAHRDPEVWYRWDIRLMMDITEKWPKYSGDSLYPIPGGLPSYKDAREYGLMWDKGTVYGALRWELLDWLIETLEKDIES